LEDSLSTVAPARGRRVLSRLGLPRVTLPRTAALLVAAAILFAGWLYVRSSSLVAIKSVQITGLAGADAEEIRTALRNEVVTMTTLNVSTAKLDSALAGYPHVAGVRVVTHFPHGVSIAVDEQTPVATVLSGGRTVAVDGAGQLLRRDGTAGLPRLPIAPDTGGDRVTAAGTRATLAVLAAAPYQLLPHIQSARSTLQHGITVQLRNGPDLYFGDSSQLPAKWSAAVATLANANSSGAAYIDVSASGKPAAGTGS
jgi:cell division protein FtsQ